MGSPRNRCEAASSRMPSCDSTAAATARAPTAALPGAKLSGSESLARRVMTCVETAGRYAMPPAVCANRTKRHHPAPTAPEPASPPPPVTAPVPLLPHQSTPTTRPAAAGLFAAAASLLSPRAWCPAP